MVVELQDTIRSLAMRYGNYRFAQGQARERGENDKADEYANEADKAWRELCAATKPDGVDAPPEPGLVRNVHHRPSEEGTFRCTCESYPHKSWCGEWMRAVGVQEAPAGYERMRGGKPAAYWRDNALEAAAQIAEAYHSHPGVAADIRAMKSTSGVGVGLADQQEGGAETFECPECGGTGRVKVCTRGKECLPQDCTCGVAIPDGSQKK